MPQTREFILGAFVIVLVSVLMIGLSQERDSRFRAEALVKARDGQVASARRALAEQEMATTAAQARAEAIGVRLLALEAACARPHPKRAVRAEAKRVVPVFARCKSTC